MLYGMEVEWIWVLEIQEPTLPVPITGSGFEGLQPDEARVETKLSPLEAGPETPSGRCRVRRKPVSFCLGLRAED